MRSPFSLLYLLLFIFAVSFLLAFVQVGLLTIAFDKLGLSVSSAFLLLFASLFGSAINLPLFTIDAEHPDPELIPPRLQGLLRQAMREFTGKTIIAMNVGGCLIPVMFSLYLIRLHNLPWAEIITATAIVALVCRTFSRPVPGLGIGMPIFIAPICAAITALLISTDNSAPLAYISGTLGVLIGADLLRLNDIRRMGTPIASIGGASS